MLQRSLDTAKQAKKIQFTNKLEGSWKGLRKASDEDFDVSPATGVEIETPQRHRHKHQHPTKG